MGGRVEPSVVLGVGTVKLGNIELPGMATVRYNKEMKTMEAKKGHVGGKHVIPYDWTKTLEVEWEQQTAEAQAGLMGDDLTTTVDVPHVAEKQTIAANEITLTHTPLKEFSETVWQIAAATGKRTRFQRVAAAPAVGEYNVVVLTAVFTFNAGDTGDVFVTYKSTGGTGKRVTDNDASFPDAFTCEAILEEYKVDEGAYSTDPMGFSAALCQPVGPVVVFDAGEGVKRYTLSCNVAGAAYVDWATT